MKPQDNLYNFCNTCISRAAASARRNDVPMARAQLFEALDTLKILDSAEKSPERQSFYRAKALDLLDLATLLRTQGCSAEVLDIFADYAGQGFMEAPIRGISAELSEPDETIPDLSVADMDLPPVEQLIPQNPSQPAAPSEPAEQQPSAPVQPVSPAEPAAPPVSQEPVQPPVQPQPVQPEPPQSNAQGNAPQGAGSEPPANADNRDNAGHAPSQPNSPFGSYDASGVAMRPQRLKDFFGQPQAVNALKDPINKARLSGTALPHVLLFGSHGLGKTTLAKIIANEMGAGFVEINNARTLTAESAIKILSELKEGDVVFIDEVHNVQEHVASGVLYSAMEDFRVSLVQGKGKFTKTVVKELPHFTLIGATTEAGKLARPFHDRFRISCRLHPYSDEVLANIAENSFNKLGVSTTHDVAMDIARRSRSTPRIVNSYVSRIADKAIVRAAEQKGIVGKGSLDSIDKIRALNVVVTPELAREYFDESGVDSIGLRDGDRMLLNTIIKMFNGGPVGQENLAKALNESVNVISEEYESYLIKLGFINVLPSGRIAMPKAYRHLKLPVPQNVLNFEVEQNDLQSNVKQDKPVQPNGPQPPAQPPVAPQQDAPVRDAPHKQPQQDAPYDPAEYDVTLNNDHPERKSKVDMLLCMDGAQIVPDETLDERFPDLERTYESAAKNISTVHWHVGNRTRELYCDSKLERRFIAYISSCGYVKDIKTQCLTLEYQKVDGASSKQYYPDFFLLTSDGRVVIVEMKNITSMSNHLNMAKYSALERYARSHGYGYAEVGKDERNKCYMSVEQLRSRPVNTKLAEAIERTMASRQDGQGGYFDQADYDAFVAETKCDPLDVHTLLLNSKELKNVDRTGGLRIVRRDIDG